MQNNKEVEVERTNERTNKRTNKRTPIDGLMTYGDAPFQITDLKYGRKEGQSSLPDRHKRKVF